MRALGDGGRQPRVDRGTLGWRFYFRAQYRMLRLLSPLLRWAWSRRLPGLAAVVDLEIQGRLTGRPRRTLVTLLTVEGHWYVGHPNGEAAWTRNLAATGVARLGLADGTEHEVAAVRLYGGPEREAVIRATWSQQPFPADIVYMLARAHVRRIGIYYRLIERSEQREHA
jgi:hypothetical protein